MTLDRSRRTRLTRKTAELFAGDTLFERIARVVCEAECLPRKELYESWEVARRTRRRFRGGRVVDLACGHGLVAHLMLILDDTSEAALAVDVRLPKSAGLLSRALVVAWPRLASRVTLASARVDEVAIGPRDVVVASHACGALTDVVLSRAAAAGARVAVLPCCHDTATCDTGGLEGWLDAELAIDATRARRLAERGYSVHTQLIPADITPRRRLLFGAPQRDVEARERSRRPDEPDAETDERAGDSAEGAAARRDLEA